MWRSKKFIIIGLLATVVLVSAGIGGVALAQENEEDSQPQSKQETLLSKICEIYQEKTGVAIDSAVLEEAFIQARKEMQEEALDNYLQKLVDEGKITEEEAAQYKAWLQAKPDLELYRQQLKEWMQARPDVPSEFKEWQQAKPDVPVGPGLGSLGRFRAMGRLRGWAGLGANTQ